MSLQFCCNFSPTTNNCIGGQEELFCVVATTLAWGFVDPINLIILAILASKGYVAFLPTTMTSLVFVKFLVIIC
jgi:hypothetical protein